MDGSFASWGEAGGVVGPLFGSDLLLEPTLVFRSDVDGGGVDASDKVFLTVAARETVPCSLGGGEGGSDAVIEMTSK